MSNNNLNEKILIGSPNKVVINNTNFILISEYKKRNNDFYEIIFNNNGKEVFLGKFNKEFGKIAAKYNEGKILIFVENSINDKAYVITNVLGLYDILDDTFYSMTEEEALNTFDANLDSVYLKNKRNLIAREDVEKRHKVRIKLS